MENNNNKVEFNLKNIMAGKFGERKSGKVGEWKMYASYRLLQESGQEISDEMNNFITNIKYKWYYYKKLSDDNKGNVIIGLHKKDVEGWVYVVVKQDGSYKDYSTIQEAKQNLV